MTNIKLLKSKLILLGYEDFTTALSQILEISYGAASAKLNNKSEFKQSEITALAAKLNLSDEDIKKIFIEGAS